MICTSKLLISYWNSIYTFRTNNNISDPTTIFLIVVLVWWRIEQLVNHHSSMFSHHESPLLIDRVVIPYILSNFDYYSFLECWSFSYIHGINYTLHYTFRPFLHLLAQHITFPLVVFPLRNTLHDLHWVCRVLNATIDDCMFPSFITMIV